MQKYAAFMAAFLFLLPALYAQSQTCTDTDAGNNFFVKGTVTSFDRFGNGKTATDSCNGPLLTEYYCIGNAFTSTSFNCEANGYNCVDGACQRQPGDEFCKDNDSGIDTRTRGQITWVDEASKENKATDECSGDFLTEYFCDRKKHNSMQINCKQESQNFVCYEGRCVIETRLVGGCSPGSRRCSADGFKLQLCSQSGYWLDEAVCSGGCIGGQCLQAVVVAPKSTDETPPSLPESEPYCSDTDNGKNFENLGRAYGTAADGTLFEKPDICSDKSMLLEYFCEGNEFKAEKYNCNKVPGYVCSDGRCRFFAKTEAAKFQQTTAKQPAQAAAAAEDKVEIFNLRKLVSDFDIGTGLMILVIAAVFYFLGKAGKR